MALVVEDRFSSAREMAAALSIRPIAPPRSVSVPGRGASRPGRTSRKGVGWGTWALGGLAALTLCIIVTAASVVLLRSQGGRSDGTQAQATGTAGAVATASTAEAVATSAGGAPVTAAAAHETATHDALASATAQASRATATAKAQGTAAAESQATATAAARLNESVRAASHWPLVLADTFDSNANGWPTGSSSGQRGTTMRSLSNGKYRFSGAATSDHTLFVSPPMIDPLYDFYATVEARRISGTESNFYRLAFQLDQQVTHAGFFLISDTGEFAVSALEDGETATLVGRTESPAIRRGEMNRLTVVSAPTTFSWSTTTSSTRPTTPSWEAEWRARGYNSRRPAIRVSWSSTTSSCARRSHTLPVYSSLLLWSTTESLTGRAVSQARIAAEVRPRCADRPPQGHATTPNVVSWTLSKGRLCGIPEQNSSATRAVNSRPRTGNLA